MQIDVIDQGAHAKRLTIAYTAAELAQKRSDAIARLAKSARLPGFRPGKGNKALLERRWSKDADVEVEQDLVQEGLRAAIRDHALDPVGSIQPPTLSRETGFTAVLEFEVRPKIVLPDLAALTVDTTPVETTDAMVDERLLGFRQRHGSMKTLAAGEPVMASDRVVLTGSITRDGATVRDVADLRHLVGAYPLFGKEPAQVVELFKDRTIADVIEFDTTLPDDFVPAEAAGKPAHIRCTIQEAQRLIPAEVDAAFCTRFGCTDRADLVAKIRQVVDGEVQERHHQAQLAQLLDSILEKTPVDLPPRWLAERITQAERTVIAEAEAGTPEGEERTKAVEEARATAKVQAERGLASILILDALAKQSKIRVDQHDLQRRIEELARRTGETPEVLAKRLQSQDVIHMVVAELAREKALDQLLQRALGAAGVAPSQATQQAMAQAGTPVHVHGPDCQHDH